MSDKMNLFEIIEHFGEDHVSNKAFWAQMNLMLSECLKRRDFADVAMLMRHGKVDFISSENWVLIADILEGKYKQPTRSKSNNLTEFLIYRNRLIALKVLEWVADEGITMLDVFDLPKKRLPDGFGVGDDLVKAIYYKYTKYDKRSSEIKTFKRYFAEIKKKYINSTITEEELVMIQDQVNHLHIPPILAIEIMQTMPSQVQEVLRAKVLSEVRKIGRAVQLCAINTLQKKHPEVLSWEIF